MAAFVLNWFEDEDPRDLRRWAIAAAIVLGVHLGAIAAYLYVHEPNDIGDDVTPVSVELSPSDDTVDQTEVAPVPEVQQPQVQQPPPQDTPTIMAPPPPPQPVQEQKPPTPAQAARVKGGAPHISSSWETSLVKHLEQFKRYPSGAQAQGQEGVVMLSFSVDRDGHVLAHQIVQSSGHPELDAEVMAMIERAQPLPPFPADMTDTKLDLTVPIRFSLK
jgi:periplasmic protein TonB